MRNVAQYRAPNIPSVGTSVSHPLSHVARSTESSSRSLIVRDSVGSQYATAESARNWSTFAFVIHSWPCGSTGSLLVYGLMNFGTGFPST